MDDRLIKRAFVHGYNRFALFVDAYANNTEWFIGRYFTENNLRFPFRVAIHDGFQFVEYQECLVIGIIVFQVY